MSRPEPEAMSPPDPRSGFPFDARPTGWFQVAWSDELAAGDVRPLRCFSRDLVCWRDERGQAHVHDAHCPHLGAHLGYGGVVAHGCIVCPMHGWQWAPDGSARTLPSGRPCPDAHLRPWPVAELDGQIWVWHELDGRPPAWQLPRLPEASDDRYRRPYPWATHAEEVALCPQLVVENLADMAHIPRVHGWDEVPTLRDLRTDDHVIAGTIDGAVPEPGGGTASVRVAVEWHGLGMSIQRLHGLPLPAVQLIAVTPVDPDRSLVRLTTWIGDREPGPRPGRLATAVARLQVEEVIGARGDRGIWERQRYVERPPFAREEARSFTVVRRWSRQFYPVDA